ncbi:intracellular short-chain-length polyhydroxyalkanoate depolymerase [Paenibacillus marinisediminis]
MSMEMKSVELPNGERLGYREREGGNKKLLLIHGNMNSSAHWDVVLEQMDPQYKIYAVDLRGFGISTYNTPAASLDIYAEDVRMFMDAIDLDSCAVMGWSTGGGIAMELASRYPERVSELILLASVSTRGYPFYEDGEDGMPNLTKRITTAEGIRAVARNQMVEAANVQRNKEFMRSLYNSVIYDKNQPDETRYEMYLDDILTQRNLMDIYTALNAFNISHGHYGASEGTGMVDRIVAPTLVLRGDRDWVISKEMYKETLEDFNGRAEGITLTDCGHSPLIDDSAQLLKAVESFLQGRG